MVYTNQQIAELLKQPFQISFSPPLLDDSIQFNQDVFEAADLKNNQVSLLQASMITFELSFEQKQFKIEQSIHYHAMLNQEKNTVSIQIADNHFNALEQFDSYAPSDAIIDDNNKDIGETDVLAQVNSNPDEYLKLLTSAKEPFVTYLNSAENIQLFKQILGTLALTT